MYLLNAFENLFLPLCLRKNTTRLCINDSNARGFKNEPVGSVGKSAKQY